MIALIVLVLCAVPRSLGHPILFSPPVPHFIGESVDELVNANKDAAVFVTKGLGELHEDLNTVLKGLINGFNLLAGPALDVGAETINHFLDSGTKFVSDFPLIASAVEVASKALEVKIKLLNTLIKDLLNVTKNFADSKLDVWNSLERTYFESLEQAFKQCALVIKQHLAGQANHLNEEYRKTRLGFEAAFRSLPKGELIHKS